MSSAVWPDSTALKTQTSEVSSVSTDPQEDYYSIYKTFMLPLLYKYNYIINIIIINYIN